jgi:kynureninase
MSFAATLEHARTLDAEDELAPLRARFATPDAQIYLCGHSLGLAPHAARERVLEELEDWERLGVRGHHVARRPWIDYAEALTAGLAALTGAHALEVVAMNSLTVNLHLMMASFYRPDARRFRVLIEAGAFSSDRHAVASQIAWHGFDPAEALIEVEPRPGEDLLRDADIEAAIERAGDSLALVLWPGLQFRSGQAFELAPIAAAAHRAGARVGFDLAHAIGNLPLALHASEADFAVWCSYKFLNGGPGAIGGAFVHERHAADPRCPRLAGWWGHAADSRFEMRAGFLPEPGAAGWALSNPPILSSAPLLASLELFDEAGMPRLRAKSRRLTAWLEFLLRTLVAADIELLTPSDPDRRGCQLSIRVRGAARRGRRVFEALMEAGIVIDFREPDVIRIAPVPLYNRFEDCWHAAQALAAALARNPAT